MSTTAYYTILALKLAATAGVVLIWLGLLQSLARGVRLRSMRQIADLKLREHMQRSNQPTEQTHD